MLSFREGPSIRTSLEAVIADWSLIKTDRLKPGPVAGGVDMLSLDRNCREFWIGMSNEGLRIGTPCHARF